MNALRAGGPSRSSLADRVEHHRRSTSDTPRHGNCSRLPAQVTEAKIRHRLVVDHTATCLVIVNQKEGAGNGNSDRFAEKFVCLSILPSCPLPVLVPYRGPACVVDDVNQSLT